MALNQVEELNANESQITVGTTTVVILPDQRGTKTRKGFILTNVSTSGQVISLSYGSDAVAGQGPVLYPGGSVWEFRDTEFLVFQAQVSAVASANGALLAVQERVDPINQ